MLPSILLAEIHGDPLLKDRLLVRPTSRIPARGPDLKQLMREVALPVLLAILAVSRDDALSLHP